MVEQIGSGIGRIRNEMKESGLAPPEFTIEGMFSVVLKRIGSVKSSVKSSVKILELLNENPKISAASIATEIGLSLRAVEKQLANLTQKGHIRHTGPAKGGEWEVLIDKEK